MVRWPRAFARRLDRVRRVEPFVRRLVAGGIALVAGLWLVEFDTAAGPAWLGGLALVAVGVWALATGIRSQVER